MAKKTFAVAAGGTKGLQPLGDGTDAEVVATVGAAIVSTTAVVASGQSLSAAVSLALGRPAGVQLPANIDSATKLSFQVSYDGGSTYDNFYDAYGNEYSVTVAASRSVPLEVKDFIGATHLKVRLGLAAAAVTATADRTIILALLP